MGAVSMKKVDNLFWLGRYTERVFTTMQVFNKIYDRLIDQDDFAYDEFCYRLSIPNIYMSKSDFIRRYLFDADNPDSLLSNMERAYDNAIILREDLSSESLAYIQLTLDVIKSSSKSESPIWSLLPLTDYLFAFWGSVEDNVTEDKRNILKVGKLVERLDLYMRLGMDMSLIEREYNRLKSRVARLHIKYDEEGLRKLGELVNLGKDWESHHREAFEALDSILGTL